MYVCTWIKKESKLIDGWNSKSKKAKTQKKRKAGKTKRAKKKEEEEEENIRFKKLLISRT